MKIKNVLIATDLSEHSQITIQRAGQLFGSGVQVTLLTVVNSAPIPVSVDFQYPIEVLQSFEAETIKAANSGLDRMSGSFVGTCRKEVLVSGVTPAQAIVEFANERPFDLIVIGSHGAGHLSSVFLGTTAQKIIKLAEHPVLVIPEKIAQTGKIENKSTLFSKILIGTDLSETSLKVLRAFSDAVLEGNENITLATVLTPLYYPVGPQGFDVAPANLTEYLEHRLPQTEKQLTDLAKMYLKDRKIECKVLESNEDAAQGLCDFANTHACDAIVIGSHGQGIAANLFIGSTVQHILKLSLCPVLVIPAKMHV